MEEQEINKKRKNNHQEFTGFNNGGDDGNEQDNDLLELSLSTTAAANRVSFPMDLVTSEMSFPVVPYQREQLQMVSQPSLMETLLYQPPPSLPLQLSPNHSIICPSQELVLSCSSSSLNTTKALREGQSETVPPPYPWATSHRATVHTLNYLLSIPIPTITGDVQCKRCERQYEMGYDLKTKFTEIATYIAQNKESMHDRAPSVWRNPVLPKCKFCDQENSAKPVISDKKKSINWLFLLLGQLLGCCTLEQLKYFCKHTKNHRTGAKDRVLYLTYLGLCKQLDPNGPFDR
ncbi:hypothetical protein GOBAR_AA08089 [Gossypium barbadense]|uniref:DUF7086 domain-containing protein n=1 Tax=Gossypium barbadense TaxID=3634 RepID=A0A2P5YAB0_GOSBA|nr:hypothetical protein GOBAR_AA08089 [Gossypium barbadense]